MRYLHLGEGHVIYYIVTHLCVKKKKTMMPVVSEQKFFLKKCFGQYDGHQLLQHKHPTRQ